MNSVHDWLHSQRPGQYSSVVSVNKALPSLLMLIKALEEAERSKHGIETFNACGREASSSRMPGDPDPCLKQELLEGWSGNSWVELVGRSPGVTFFFQTFTAVLYWSRF